MKTATEWRFTYQDMADLCNIEYDRVLQDRVRGRFDPEDLLSIVTYLVKRMDRKYRAQLIESLVEWSEEKKPRAKKKAPAKG